MGTNLFNLKWLWLDRGRVPDRAVIINHVIIIAASALLAHFAVWAVRLVSDWLVRKSAAKKPPFGFVTQQPKFITLTGLISSAVTFVVYFLALGLVLQEFNVNLTAYLATASVIGLAVGFGSQGLVQDVVTGLTLIFSDTLAVGDIIEVAGRIGRVERVGLRFTELQNSLNQQVYIPNRVIADFSRFPRGGIRAFIDVQLPASADANSAAGTLGQIAGGMRSEFSAIILSSAEISGVQRLDSAGWSFIRLELTIWPGQGGLIEGTFRSRIIAGMKALDPNYADWMVTVTYRA